MSYNGDKTKLNTLTGRSSLFDGRFVLWFDDDSEKRRSVTYIGYGADKPVKLWGGRHRMFIDTSSSSLYHARLKGTYSDQNGLDLSPTS